MPEPPTGSEIPPIGERFARAETLTDWELAAKIRTDAHERMQAGSPVSLEDYLRACPSIAERPLALDAAISAAIGGVSGSVADEGSLASITASFPELSDAIERTACLDALLGASVRTTRAPFSPEQTRIPSEIGTVLRDGRPRYRLLERLGHGSAGTVLLAEDRLLTSPDHPALVSVKVVRCDDDERVRREVLDEARRARTVEHPSVIRVLDCGEFSGGVFIVHEHVEGTTLHELFLRAEGRPSLRALVQMMNRVASGLQGIHDAGLVHGDMKPQNVMISHDGDAKIIDFGSSGALRRRSIGSDLIAAGTLPFMAPERFEGAGGEAGPTSDVFSLAAMMYWCITGSPVVGDSTLEAMVALRDARGWQTSVLAATMRERGISDSLSRVISRSLSYFPAHRHQTAGELAGDLRAWSERRPVEWTNPSLPSRAGLLLRRRWLVCSVAALTIAAGTVTTMAVRSAIESSREARESERLAYEEREQAAAERARAEAESTWRQRSIDSLTKLLDGFRATQSKGLEAEVMTSLWVLEWVHGSDLLKQPEMLDAIWDTRIDVLERTRESMTREGNGTSIAARLSEPSLALWMLHDGRAEEAREILRGAVAYWEPRTSGTDPWLRELRTMLAASEVALALDGSGTPDETSVHALRVAHVRNTLEGRVKGPLPVLVAQTLRRLDAARRDSE